MDDEEKTLSAALEGASAKAERERRELIDRLKAEHGDVYEIEAGEARIMVKMPKPVHLERFTATVTQDESQTWRAQRRLILDCLVHPDKAGYLEIEGETPGIVASFAKAIADLCGMSRKATAEKL